MRKIIKIFLIIYSVFLLIYIIVEFSPLEFTKATIKSIFYEYTILGIPFYGILLGLFIVKKRIWNVITGIGLGIVGLFILKSLIISFSFWHSHTVWETTEIIAVHKKNKETLIVEQRIDSGALGYSTGIFKTTPITSFLSWNIDYYGKTLDENWEIKTNRILETGY